MTARLISKGSCIRIYTEMGKMGFLILYYLRHHLFNVRIDRFTVIFIFLNEAYTSKLILEEYK